ncbi:MAG: HlyC/CorC family transporter [Flavipsychrobacter sp.]|nr:HlyC/CorC family transporter [Flavipsychrobacter sp.]
MYYIYASAYTNMVFEIILTLFLVFLNGFFVAAEFAIVKVRSSQIDIRTNVNKTVSAAAKNVINHLDAYLAATQLGITLASLGLGWVGEEVTTALLIKMFDAFGFSLNEATAHKLAVPFAFATITVLHIVFGELAPKSIAIRYPASVTFGVALPLRVFYFIFRPFIWALNGFANFLLRIIGVKTIHGNEIHSEEELKMIITESEEGGAIEQTEREMIQNVFDFDDRRVWDILNQRKNISALSADMSLPDMISFAVQEGYSRYPVYEGDIDNIKGIIYTKDLMKIMASGNTDQSITPLIRSAYFIPESKKIKDVLRDLQRRHMQMAIVTSEVGEVAGIVTMEDILEELVGEIQDEYDNEKPYVEKTSDTTFWVNAHYKISDINKYIPYRFEESEHYDTLSGYITYMYQGDIREGSQIRLGRYDITILKMYRNSPEAVELKIADAAESDDED